MEYEECSAECNICKRFGCWETDGVEGMYQSQESTLKVPCLNCLKSKQFIWDGSPCYGGVLNEDESFHRNTAEEYAFYSAWLFIDRFEDSDSPLFDTKTIDEWVNIYPDNLKELVISSYQEQMRDMNDILSDDGTEENY